MMATRPELGCLNKLPAGADVDQTYLTTRGKSREPKTAYTDAALSRVFVFLSSAPRGTSHTRHRHDKIGVFSGCAVTARPNCRSLPADLAARYRLLSDSDSTL